MVSRIRVGPDAKLNRVRFQPVCG